LDEKVGYLELPSGIQITLHSGVVTETSNLSRPTFMLLLSMLDDTIIFADAEMLRFTHQLSIPPE
jgi:hypothetical protein